MKVNLKNLSKKQKIILVTSVIIILSIVLAIVLFTINTIDKSNAKTTYTNSNIPNLPNVTSDNLVYELSTLEETEEVTLTVSQHLKNYNLYYLVYSSDPDKNINIANIENNESTAETNLEEKEYISKLLSNLENYTLYENDIKITEISTVYFVYEKDKHISNYPYKIEINNIIKKLQTEDSTDALETEQIDKNDKSNNTSKYYIKVNYGANTVTVYQKDENNEYTIPVKAMVCSCGKATPKSGVYKTSRGYVWGALIGGVYGKYSTRIVGSILFHSVPYTSPANDALEYWEFDKLGQTASAGCIRLQVSDCKWIFDNCGSGTMVEFYSSADPGPLGKPSAPKISDNEACRNWDPTDYEAGNPWFSQPTEKPVEENNKEQKQELTEENTNIIPWDTRD